MEDLVTFVLGALHRLLDNLAGRITGPMQFRLVLQPMMAALFAIRAGLRDATAGRPAYFWDLFASSSHRRDLLREGWKDVGRVFLFAVLIDAVYQMAVARWFYPGEALIVATVLAFFPYLVLRGLVTRGARRLGHRQHG